MRIASYCTTIFTATLLAACGGGGGTSTTATTPSTTPSTTPAVATTTISGSAVKGPVMNANVTIRNALTNAVVATTTTGVTGAYSVAVPFTGDVIVEVGGGTYTDEATGASTALSTPLKAVLSANGGAVTGIVTPLTTMAYTSAFGTGATVTTSAFNTAATKLATQYQLNGVNLATTLPTVTVDANSYGKALRGISKYLQQQNVSLQTLLTTPMTAAQLSAFSGTYTTAYNSINPGSPVTFKFDDTGVTIGGTGAGGGTGTCGVNVVGTITTQGFTVPLNLDYCFTGIAGGSCDSGNSSLSQSLAGQGGVAAGVNLVYKYSTACAANAISIKLQ